MIRLFMENAFVYSMPAYRRAFDDIQTMHCQPNYLDALQPNSTLAPTAVNATIGNANPLGRVSAVQPFAEAPGCVPTVYDLLKTNRNATTFLRLANLTGAYLISNSRWSTHHT
jgi:hypothetical protein